MRYCLKGFTIEADNRCVTRFTQPRGILCNHIEHRLDIGRRTGDDAQDFTRCSLLFQSIP